MPNLHGKILQTKNIGLACHLISNDHKVVSTNMVDEKGDILIGFICTEEVRNLANSWGWGLPVQIDNPIVFDEALVERLEVFVPSYDE